jgi:hypothetical protein
MADHEDTQKSSSEQPAETPAMKAEAALPAVESPSISPAKDDEPAEADLTTAKDEPVANSEALVTESDSPIAPATNVIPLRLALRRRRMALLAASVTVAVALGAVIGAVTANSLASTHDQVSSVQERKVMQQTIARLGDELSTLKTSLDAASKSAHAQTAQLAKLSQTMNEKLAAATTKANAALAQASAEVTGSIAAPQTVAAQQAALAEPTPLPQPRPQQIAAVESLPRPLVVPGWSVRGAARGAVLVESHGEIYEVVPGASLPGLGRVESIRRIDGRWIVQTPKGLIVSAVAHRARYFD